MIPATVRIFVYTEPVDMRRGFDGLALIARDALSQDPRSGAVFIFANRRTDRLKAVWWDRNGYCLLYKRAHARCSSCHLRAKRARRACASLASCSRSCWRARRK